MILYLAGGILFSLYILCFSILLIMENRLAQVSHIPLVIW